MLMYLSLEALRPTIRTSYPIVVKLINLVNSVTQMVNFPVRIPESLIPSLLDLFISSDASICSNKLSLMLLSQFPLTCLQLQKGCTVYDYSCADKNGHCDHLTDVAADAQFYEWSLVPGWN